MSPAPATAHRASNATATVSLKYQSLLGAGHIEVAWERDDEPVTLRNPAAADRIAADVPVILDRAA